MISVVKWLPRGAANAHPHRFELSSAELEMLKKRAASEQSAAMADDDQEEESKTPSAAAPAAGAAAVAAAAAVDGGDERSAEELEFLRSINMDGYDDDDDGLNGDHAMDDDDDDAMNPTTRFDDALGGGGDGDDEDDEPSSDEEDREIRPTDDVCVVARTENDEQSSVSVYVYDSTDESLYVHHDFNLPAFPLALAWMDRRPKHQDAGLKGNFLAVGTFEPGIEIWNLDVMDVIEPTVVLGGRNEPTAAARENLRKALSQKKKPKEAKLRKLQEAATLGELKPESHKDAVMALSWNSQDRTTLASGSADSSVKLWDISTASCTRTLDKLHSSKVQSLEWHPVEQHILLSGGFDRAVNIFDVRSSDSDKCRTFKAGADIEKVRWNPHNPAQFVAATESGSLLCFDIRKQDTKPLFSLTAHRSACTDVCFNATAPGLIATSSLTKVVKLWDATSGDNPKCVAKRKLGVGKIFTVDFSSAASPFTLAAAGSDGTLAVWDTLNSAAIREKFGQFVPAGVDLTEYTE